MSGIVCISGIDSSGGAGISADIRVCTYMGIHCYPVITTITTQTHDRVVDVEPVPGEMIVSQLRAAMDFQNPGAIKIGLMNSPASIECVARILNEISIPILVDPVLGSSSGQELVTHDFASAFKKTMIPISTLLTPNIPEAEKLTGIKIEGDEEIKKACQLLHDIGAKYVLVKGGHRPGDVVVDTLFDGRDFRMFTGQRISGEFRGTGCAYSTLIACYLASGSGMVDAVSNAKIEIQKAISAAAFSGTGDNLILFGGRHHRGPEAKK